MAGCVEIFLAYLREIKQQLAVEDPNYLELNIQVSKIEQFIDEMYQDKLPAGVPPRETAVFLTTRERTARDQLVVPIMQEEEYKFNMVLTMAIAVILALFFYAK